MNQGQIAQNEESAVEDYFDKENRNAIQSPDILLFKEIKLENKALLQFGGE